MKPLRCRFGFHAWAKIAEVDLMTLVRLRAYRVCHLCGARRDKHKGKK